MSKTTLRYTLIGEGFAEYQFIPAYINWVVSSRASQLKVSRTKVQIAITKNPSVSKVLQGAGMLVTQSFADRKDPCDLCIVGIDLDKPDHTDDLEYHSERLRELRNSMGQVFRTYEKQITLFVPIQAIDCWVHYTQQNANANSLESVGKDEIKKSVYGEKNPDRQRIEKVVREAATKADFAKLSKQSRSFNHFHQQVITFLDQYNKPQPK